MAVCNTTAIDNGDNAGRFPMDRGWYNVISNLTLSPTRDSALWERHIPPPGPLHIRSLRSRSMRSGYSAADRARDSLLPTMGAETHHPNPRHDPHLRHHILRLFL